MTMDKNTLVFLLIVIAIIAVVAVLLWKSTQKAETNKYDAISAWAGSAQGVGEHFMDNFFGGGKKK